MSSTSPVGPCTIRARSPTVFAVSIVSAEPAGITTPFVPVSSSTTSVDSSARPTTDAASDDVISIEEATVRASVGFDQPGREARLLFTVGVGDDHLPGPCVDEHDRVPVGVRRAGGRLVAAAIDERPDRARHRPRSPPRLRRSPRRDGSGSSAAVLANRQRPRRVRSVCSPCRERRLDRRRAAAIPVTSSLPIVGGSMFDEVEFTCPRCQTPTVEEFYGPCPTCRDRVARQVPRRPAGSSTWPSTSRR